VSPCLTVDGMETKSWQSNTATLEHLEAPQKGEVFRAHPHAMNGSVPSDMTPMLVPWVEILPRAVAKPSIFTRQKGCTATARDILGAGFLSLVAYSVASGSNRY
jgi:hypothetical protein